METAVSAIDIAGSDGLSRRELETIRAQHDKLARVLTSNISALLRFSLMFRVLKVEQTTFDELQKQRTDPACQFVVRCGKETAGAILLDSASAQAFLELILGGKPKSSEEPRSLTEVELALLHDLTHQIRAEWENSWQTYAPVRISDALEEDSHARQEAFFGHDQAVAVAMAMEGEGVTGEIWLALKVRVVRQARREEEEKRKIAPKSVNPSRQRQVLDRLMPCDLVISAHLPAGASRFGELLSLQPGDVILFDAPTSRPIGGAVNGQMKLSGEIVESAGKRALLVHALEGVRSASQPSAPAGKERRRAPRNESALPAVMDAEVEAIP